MKLFYHAHDRPNVGLSCFFGSPKYVKAKENAFASHAFRKICSAVKKAAPDAFLVGRPLWALSEQSIVGNLSDQYTVTNTTKATPDPCSASLPLLGWANFSFLPPLGFGALCPKRLCLLWPFQSRSPQAKPAGENTHSLCWKNGCNYVIVRWPKICKQIFSSKLQYAEYCRHYFRHPYVKQKTKMRTRKEDGFPSS